MIILKTVLKFIKILGSETAPASIAFAVMLGCFLGFNPLLSLQSLLVILAVLFFRVNIASTLFSLAIFKLLSFPLSPLFHKTGIALLENDTLVPFWTFLYNTAPFPLTRFNNSVFLGGLAFSIILAPVLFFGGIIFVQLYRGRLEPYILNSKLAKVITASKLYKLYVKLTSPVGGGGRP